jgi:peptide chain release factor 1
MIEKLQAIEDHYLDLEHKISDPEVIARQDEWRRLTKEHARLTEIVTAFRAFKAADSGLQEAKEMLQESSDEEMTAYLKEEIAANTEKIAELTEQLKILLLPRDPNDEKSVIVEIRAGTGC